MTDLVVTGLVGVALASSGVVALCPVRMSNWPVSWPVSARYRTSAGGRPPRQDARSPSA